MSIPVNPSRPHAEGGASPPFRSPHAYSCPNETAAERLPDDLLVEILSRVPAKSVCRFKCVSKHWLGLICDPSHRKRLPQTLEGFFYGVDAKKGKSFIESPVRFTDISGTRRRPPLDFAFLPNNSRRIELSDCCNGLLLCRWYGVSGSDDEFRYVVCNPATEQWLALPDSGQPGKVATARLGFDPAVSSHFHVFVLLEEDRYHELASVHVYSSKTGRWIHKENGWDRDMSLRTFGSPAVFLDSYMHFGFSDGSLCNCVASVHTEGETWMSFDAPYGVENSSIQQSQGRLHYVGFGMDDDDVFNQVVVYVLEDYDSKRWVLKHSVHIAWVCFDKFDWIAIHPHCNLIFFTMGERISLTCYNMDRRQTKVICDLRDGFPPYLPYVPLHAELQSLHMGPQ